MPRGCFAAAAASTHVLGHGLAGIVGMVGRVGAGLRHVGQFGSKSKKSFGREGERKKKTVDGTISGLCCCCCRDGGALVGKRQPPVPLIYIQLETKLSVAFCRPVCSCRCRERRPKR